MLKRNWFIFRRLSQQSLKVLIALNLGHCQSQDRHPSQCSGVNSFREWFMWLLNGPARQLNSLPLAIEVWRWCKIFEFSPALRAPVLAPLWQVALMYWAHPSVSRREETGIQKSKNLLCFYMVTAKTIRLRTEGQNIAAKSLLDC